MQASGLSLLWHAVLMQLIDVREAIVLVYRAHGEFLIAGSRIYVHPADK